MTAAHGSSPAGSAADSGRSRRRPNYSVWWVRSLRISPKAIVNTVQPEGGFQVQGRQGLILIKDETNVLIFQGEFRLHEIGTLFECLPNLLVLIQHGVRIRWRISGHNHEVSAFPSEAKIHHALEAVFRRPHGIVGHQDAFLIAGNIRFGLQDVEGRQGAYRHLLADLVEELLRQDELLFLHLQILAAEDEIPVGLLDP